MARSTSRSIRFPHNAGTTTIEALWQGVPVVSLAGRPSVGRFGAMILHAVGMDDWVAPTPMATSHAPSPRRPICTGSHRCVPTLRRVSPHSPLCDAAGLARHVEAAYRALC